MSIARRAPFRRLTRPVLPALAAAVLVLAALAGTALGNEGPTKLLDPSVSPTAGQPTTRITFEVTYRNREGSEPDYVRVAIDGAVHPMAPTTSSTSYKTGVRFRFATRLTVGSHSVVFSAMDRDRFSATLSGGKVKISATTSSGTTSGSSTTSGSGTASGSGTTSGSGAGSAAASGGTDASDIGSTDAGTPTIAPGAIAESVAGSDGGLADDSTVPVAGGTGPGALADAIAGDDRVGATATDLAGPSGADPAGSTAAGTGSDAATGGGAPAGDTAPDGSGSGSEPVFAASVLEVLGLEPSLLDRTFRAVPVLITTTGVVVAWAAFLMFGKRRRDGEAPAPDAALSAHAAAGVEAAVASLVPAGVVQLPPGVDPSEAAVPRWRRPSLLEARKADPLRNGSMTVNLTFAQGAVGPVDGKEMRRIRYRLVRLMDVPDEVRANEIGILDQGDEVQLLELRGTYWLVLCPDGRQGWLHKMVLGELVEDDAPVDLIPEAIEDDVLSAFLATRAKTA